MPDLDALLDFLAGHARLLDRRRADLALGRGDAGATLAALGAYRNGDGGFGWGLEPDLRDVSSQPAGALHAFEVLEEIGVGGAISTPVTTGLADWLLTVTLDDGGLPFALSVEREAGVAVFWAGADPAVSSLQITAAVAAAAHRVAGHDPALAAHPWLRRATDFCLARAQALREPGVAYELMFLVHLLDAAADHDERAATALPRIAAMVPADGRLAVAGGAADEAIGLLDVAPFPGRPVRARFAPEVVAAALDRLAGGQDADGGWDVDFGSFSEAGALEWRGYATVRALRILLAEGRIDG